MINDKIPVSLYIPSTFSGVLFSIWKMNLVGTKEDTGERDRIPPILTRLN
jgi:hypothetical protein